MTEKKVRFTPQDDVTPFITKMKRESEELGRGLIRDARSYTTSGKEALSYIEEQIRAIERRGKADKQSRIAELDISRTKGGVSETAYKQRVSTIQAESKGDQAQTALLRELIETIKQTANREIIEDRKGVEQQIKSSKTVSELSPGGDEFQVLKETVQRQKIGDVKTDETSEKEKFRYGKVLEKGSGVLGGVAGSKNQFFALAAGLAVIPMVGQGLSAVAQQGLEAATDYERGMAGMSQLTGRGQETMGNRMLRGYGETKAGFLGRRRAASLARGTTTDSLQAARDLMYLEKGTGVDQGMFLQQERLTRAGGGGAMAGTQRLVRGMQAVGGIQGQDMSLLGEYLPLLVSLQTEQVRLTGETNDEIATNLVAGIMSLDETFRNPDVLAGLMPSMMQGMRNPATPQAEALQYSVLSRMAPGKSFIELQSMMEAPTAESVEGVLSQLQGMGGGKGMFAQNIKGFFGLGATQALKIAEGFGKEGFNTGDVAKQIGIKNLKQRGKTGYGTGELDEASAGKMRVFETGGEAAVRAFTDTLNGVKETVKKVGEAIGEFSETVATAEKDRKESVDALLASESRLERVMGMLAGSRSVGYGPGR